MIAGPTASGKSALALALAEQINGVIVNADSMQVYHDLQIVTARPSVDEEERVPHLLYGIVPADLVFSTGEWLRRAIELLGVVAARGQVPIFVGGTGLYFKALLGGFADLPEIDPDVRARCRALAAEGGADAVRAALRAKDSEGEAGLVDLQRLTRALEVVESTGRPLHVWQADCQSDPVLPIADTVPIVLAPPRPWLHKRIEERAQMMINDRGRAEVAALLAKGLDSDLPAMRAIGVREIGALLSGQFSEEQAVEQLTIATRQYAKRQETWFRNQMADWHRLDPAIHTLSSNREKIMQHFALHTQ